MNADPHLPFFCFTNAGPQTGVVMPTSRVDLPSSSINLTQKLLMDLP